MLVGMASGSSTTTTNASVTHIKCTFVGDTGVGKTALILTYATGKFPDPALNLTADGIGKHLTLPGPGKREVYLSLWDSTGSDDLARLRALRYPGTDVCFLCFGFGFGGDEGRGGFDSVVGKWYPEIQHHLPGVPIVLVGARADLRGQSSSVQTITDEEIQLLAKQINASSYFLVSALTEPEGLTMMFEKVAGMPIGIKRDDKRRKRRCIVT